MHEIKTTAYAVLSDPKQPVAYQRSVNGLELHWTVDVIERRPDGAVKVNVDFYSNLPTIFGAKPSYQFWKRPDESVEDA